MCSSTVRTMGLVDLPIIAIDLIAIAIVSSVGAQEALRYRQVNRLFNHSINRCLFDLDFFDYENNWCDPEDVPIPSYLMAHIILGQARRRGRDNHLLTAIWNAADYCLECTMDHSSIPAVRICEAVARHMEPCDVVNILRYLGKGQLPTEDMLRYLGSYLNGDMNVHSHRLSAAIITGNYPQVCELLGLEAIDVNMENKYFGHPLHLAATTGNLEITGLLFEHGADVRARANEPDGPLGPSKYRFLRKVYNRTSGSVVQIACLGGHQKLVEMLLKIEDVRALVTRDELEMSLHNAVFSRNSYLVEFLLSIADHTYPENAPELREHVYFMATRAGNTTLIKKMLDQGADPDSSLEILSAGEFVQWEKTALSLAMDRSHALDTMRFLLDNGADPNFEGRNQKEGTANPGYYKRAYPTIYWAIRTGNIEMVELLLRYGAKEIDLKGFYDTAVMYGQDDVAQKFRELDAVCSCSPPPKELQPASPRKVTGSESE